MRNVVMAAMLVAAGVSSSYVSRTGGSDGATETAPKGKTPTVEENLPQPIDDPVDLLKDFLDPGTPPSAAVTGSCEDPIDHLRDLLSSSVRPCAPQTAPKLKEKIDGANCSAPREFPEPLNLTFIIATIPDPERTHLGLDFDRILEAIINAAEDGGFSYDRYWLPWHVNHDPANLDPRKQDILDGRSEARHRKPGVIILRRRPQAVSDEDAKKIAAEAESYRRLEESKNGALVVFLVGETPTAGINRYQFKQAMESIRSFTCDRPGVAPSYPPSVLGPTFSGSITSLRAALRADFPSDRVPLVISGSASGLNPLDGLGFTTIHTDTFLANSLEKFLTTQLRLSGGVVYLREAATDFGITPTDIHHSPASTIYYPREISRLRNVYPEQTNSSAAQVANLQQQLLLHLRDSRPGEDTLPQFSDQTPLTQETTLLQISETLRRDHVGLAVVTGTDVLDVLFLSRHLRELSPDVRLLIWDSDLLFVHGTDTLDFSGMLALSTYPLVPANHSWTDEPLARSYFASNITEGIYNACLALLSSPYLREYHSPKISSAEIPRQSSTPPPEWPPAWLSIIGDDAYWPLGLYDSSVDPAMLGVPVVGSSNLDPGRPTRAWSFIFYTCIMLALLYAGLYFYVLQKTPRLPRWCSFLHPRPYNVLPWRGSYSFFMALLLSAAHASLLIPVVRLASANHHREWVTMLVLGILAFVALLAVLAHGSTLLAPKIVIPGATLGCLAVFAVIWLINFRMGSFLDEESFFRALRSVQIGSGVGPNLPLFFLLLAFAWWASIQIQRVRLVVEHRPEVPDIAGEKAGKNIRQIDCWLRQPFLYIDPFGWGVAGGGVFITAFVAIPHVISVDGLLFDAAVCTLLISLSTLLLLATYAFSRVWRSLDRLLEALETQPIRLAFSNLPSDVSWSPLWQYGARRKSYATLIRTLESLRTLLENDPHYYPALRQHVNTLTGYVRAILTPVNQGIEEPILKIQELQKFRSKIVRDLSRKLETKNWNRSRSESLEKLKKASGTPTVHSGIASWFGFGKSKIAITSASTDLDPADQPDMLAAEIVALGYLAYIRYVMRHLRNLLSFVTTGFILITLALNCYPFQMLNLIRWSVTIGFVLMGAVLLYALQQMSHSEILRRVTDTPPGTIDTGFYTRAISVGALPLLAVVASHFPSVGRFLFSWVQPALSALH